ncbi:unnamed protein product [Calicophoron daubneyi]|uniref:Zinc finger C2H2 LYAR-type domain-containing protein n=1 Tax=Calicophoron daubneyi TaxID=300641 RepID=A0AAV2T622_CALDB
MVVFLCPICNGSLRKNSVEAHFSRCRGCRSVSCMDCHKEFDRTSFKSHTSCISESEKYDKSRHNSAKTGINKQETWTARIRSLISGSKPLNPRLREVLQSLADCANIPRKRPKFENFMRSKFRHVSPQSIQEIWDLISVSADTDNAEGPAIQSKRMRLEDGEQISKGNHNNSNANSVPPSFEFESEIQQLLNHSGNQMKLKDLRNALYAKYTASTPSDKPALTEEQFKEKVKTLIRSTLSLTLLSASTCVDKNGAQIDNQSPPSMPAKPASKVRRSKKLNNHEVTDDKNNLSDFVMGILQAANGPVRLKKLRKQLFSEYSPSLMNREVDECLEKMKQEEKITLSDDGKTILLAE